MHRTVMTTTSSKGEILTFGLIVLDISATSSMPAAEEVVGRISKVSDDDGGLLRDQTCARRLGSDPTRTCAVL